MSARPASHRFARSLLGVMAASTAVLAAIYWHIYGWDNIFGDFGIFYQASQHSQARDWTAIYDVADLRATIAAHSAKLLPFFLNPPTALLVFYPLAWFPYNAALVLWLAAQIVMLALVLRMRYFQELFAPAGGQGIGTRLLIAVAFSAFCLQCLLYAQATMLCTALFLLALAWRKTRPALSGAALGFLSFKPQLALLLPLLLLAEGNWRALAWAMGVAAALALFTCLAFTPGLWVDFRATTALLRQFLAERPALLFIITTSVYSAARGFGLSANLSFGVQACATLGMAILLWPVFRREGERRKLLMLCLAAYLATPYCLLYDITLLAVPCALLLRRAEADQASQGELMALMLLILLPVVTFLLQAHHIPYGVIAIAVALGVARSSRATPNLESESPCPPS